MTVVPLIYRTMMQGPEIGDQETLLFKIHRIYDFYFIMS